MVLGIVAQRGEVVPIWEGMGDGERGVGEMVSDLRHFLENDTLPMGTLFLWAVTMLIYYDLIAPEACRTFGYLVHLSVGW